jgi:hypothetical protein
VIRTSQELALDIPRPWLVGSVLFWRASARLGPLYGALPIARNRSEFSFGAV